MSTAARANDSSGQGSDESHEEVQGGGKSGGTQRLGPGAPVHLN